VFELHPFLTYIIGAASVVAVNSFFVTYRLGTTCVEKSSLALFNGVTTSI
jgi:hypothetical protein